MIRPFKNHIKSLLRRHTSFYHREELLDRPFWQAVKSRSTGLVTLVDVGAHEGLFYSSLCQILTVTDAILIDAQPAKIAGLKQQYGGGGTQILESAISDYIGTADFTIHQWDQSSSLKETISEVGGLGDLYDLNPKEVITVDVTTLDALVLGKIPDGTFCILKLDIQGAEEEAIRGGVETLKKVDLIICEVPLKPTYQNSASMVEITQALEGHGFVLVELFPNTRGNHSELLECDAIYAKIKND
jgi:FkbM family methyltransferase